jgi:hypothetical protein
MYRSPPLVHELGLTGVTPASGRKPATTSVAQTYPGQEVLGGLSTYSERELPDVIARARRRAASLADGHDTKRRLLPTVNPLRKRLAAGTRPGTTAGDSAAVPGYRREPDPPPSPRPDQGSRVGRPATHAARGARPGQAFRRPLPGVGSGPWQCWRIARAFAGKIAGRGVEFADVMLAKQARYTGSPHMFKPRAGPRRCFTPVWKDDMRQWFTPLWGVGTSP